MLFSIFIVGGKAHPFIDNPQMEAHIMKKYIWNNKKVKIVALALALGGAPLLTSFQLKADRKNEYRGETEQEHKIFDEIFSELAQYGNGLKGFIHFFFGLKNSCPEIMGSSATITPSKAVFLNLTQKLLEKINGIKAKIAQNKQAAQTEYSKKLLSHLEELAILLANSQANLHSTLRKYLGTKSLLKALTAFAKKEEKQIPKVNRLQKIINKLLVAHAEPQLKQQFDTFVTNIDYVFIFPKKNPKHALYPLRYIRLK